MSQRTILHELAFRPPVFTKKQRGCGWLLQTSWWRSLLFLQLSRQVWSQCSYKPSTRQKLSSVLHLLISIRMEKCYTFKDQSLENGLFCIFQAIGNILLTCSKSRQIQRLKDPLWSQIFSPLLQGQCHTPGSRRLAQVCLNPGSQSWCASRSTNNATFWGQRALLILWASSSSLVSYWVHSPPPWALSPPPLTSPADLPPWIWISQFPEVGPPPPGAQLSPVQESCWVPGLRCHRCFLSNFCHSKWSRSSDGIIFEGVQQALWKAPTLFLLL